MALLNALNGSQSSGGSVSQNVSSANSWSNTAGIQATAASAAQAEKAHQRQLELLRETQEFNAKEAQKQRDWQQKNIDIANAMANTVYSRSMKDMKAAGLNPILAAGLGLGSAGAGTTSAGTAASVNTPSTYMGQTFAEQNSASHSEGFGSGSSWNESTSGLATGLQLMGEAIAGVLENLSSSQKIEIALQGLENINKDVDNDGKTGNDEKVANTISPFIGKTPMEVLDMFMSGASNKRKAIYNGKNKNTPSYKVPITGKLINQQ